jgi:RNA polymerase subunit RPABC4/transcription elongation factor Spt4
MNWNNVSLVVLGLTAFFSAFLAALWISLVIWTFRDMRARARDAFAQLLASLMVLILGPFGIFLYLILRPRETLAERYERSLEEEALLQDIEERHICPGCKQPIEPDYVLCPICHTRLRRPCIQCGRLVHPRWSVCPYCGEGQRPVPGVDRAGRLTMQDIEAERQAAADLEEPALAPQAVAALEKEAMGNVDAAEYSEPLVPDWESVGLAAEGANPSGSQEVESAGRHPVDGEVHVPSTPDAEKTLEQTPARGKPRQTLSLFKRR